MKRSPIILGFALCAVGGCARLAVEGGDKPIHIVMDVNIKIDQQLNQFFAYEDQAPSPTTRVVGKENDKASGGVTNGGVH